MNKLVLLAGSVALLIVSQLTDLTAQHIVTAKIPRPDESTGTLHVFLCNDAKTFYNQSFRRKIVAINPKGATKVVFDNVPKGTYAIRAFQDYDGSNKLETNLMSIPKEPIGFSNNPAVRTGPPTFEAAGFRVTTNVEKTIMLNTINRSLF